MGDVNEIKKLSYVSKMQGATRSDFKLILIEGKSFIFYLKIKNHLKKKIFIKSDDFLFFFGKN